MSLSRSNCKSDSQTRAKHDGVIYWHRELPPADVEQKGECVVEATSNRMPGTLAHRDELWERCYEDLMAQASARIAQEVERLGGDCAHVLSESVDSKHDPVTGQAWLHGQFDCVVYRKPQQ